MYIMSVELKDISLWSTDIQSQFHVQTKHLETKYMHVVPNAAYSSNSKHLHGWEMGTEFIKYSTGTYFARVMCLRLSVRLSVLIITKERLDVA